MSINYCCMHRIKRKSLFISTGNSGADRGEWAIDFYYYFFFLTRINWVTETPVSYYSFNFILIRSKQKSIRMQKIELIIACYLKISK